MGDQTPCVVEKIHSWFTECTFIERITIRLLYELYKRAICPNEHTIMVSTLLVRSQNLYKDRISVIERKLTKAALEKKSYKYI